MAKIMQVMIDSKGRYDVLYESGQRRRFSKITEPIREWYKYHSMEPMPMDGQKVEPMPTDGQKVEPMPTDGQKVEPMPMDGQKVEPMPMDGQKVEPMPMDGQEVEPMPKDGQEVEPMLTGGQEVEPIPTDGQELEPMKGGELLPVPVPSGHDTSSGAGDLHPLVLSLSDLFWFLAGAGLDLCYQALMLWDLVLIKAPGIWERARPHIWHALVLSARALRAGIWWTFIALALAWEWSAPRIRALLIVGLQVLTVAVLAAVATKRSI